MAIGLAPSVLNGWVDSLCRATAYSAPAVWVKLHSGDPGTGTSNPFGDTTRQQASFAAATGGAAASNADLNWTLTAAGTVSHVSFWTASSGGSFLGSDDLAAPKTVAIDDVLTLPSGSVSVAVTPVAA